MLPTLNNSTSRKSRRSVIVVENFYEDPGSVRDYALRQEFYTPYEDQEDIQAERSAVTWWASRFKSYDKCPFKSSASLMSALSESVGEELDVDHWRRPFMVDAQSKPTNGTHAGETCLWNCCFHVKPATGQKSGEGVHNHVVDTWNCVGSNGWTGLIYLNSFATLNGGLSLWRNRDAANQFDWMTPPKNWELVDMLGNVFNRLILVRGDIPHSGADGWGTQLEDGRMCQTFFFRTIPGERAAPQRTRI